MGRAFARTLLAIDSHMGGRKFLPIFAFNNSPATVLGSAGDCPAFGYFKPQAAQDLALLLSRIPESAIEALEPEHPLATSLYWKFRSSAEEASRRQFGLAVLHDAPSIEDLETAPRYDKERFAAYAVSEGDAKWFSITDKNDPSGPELVRVESVVVTDGELHVSYKKQLASMPQATARDLIASLLLGDLLEHRYAQHVSKVQYHDLGMGQTTTRPYPKRLLGAELTS
jgi:hypothetical protein